MGIIKKIIKWIFIFFLILLFIFALVFLLDKALGILENKFGKSQKFDALTPIAYKTDRDDENYNHYNDKKDRDNNEDSDENSKKNNNKDNNSNADSKTIDIEYNPVYMDDVILLYEGKQTGKSINILLDRLIENTNQTLFSYVTVTTKGIGENKVINFDDVSSYVSSLQNIQNSLDQNAYYNVSFEYNNLKTHVIGIIIEK